MQVNVDSSDPPTTEYSDVHEEEEEMKKEEETVTALTEAMAEMKKERNTIVYILIFCIDLLIPLMLIISAISAMSFMGMLFVILMYMHVFVANRVRKSFYPLKVTLILDFIVNLAVFVFAIVSYIVTIDTEAVRILGLDFNNIISSSPTLNLVTSLIAMICQMVVLGLMQKCKVEKLVDMRKKMFGSLGFQFLIDFVWAVCNAFNAGSNSSYLYLPILIYFVISNCAQSCVGHCGLPSWVVWIIMCYSLFFGLFSLYVVSYIGLKWDPSNSLAYVYIAPDGLKAVNVVIAVIFAYISVQEMSAPGFTVGKKPVPSYLKPISDKALILAFIVTFLFGVFYPNYLSLNWLWIPFIASFATFRAVKKLFFPMLTVIFTFSFVIMSLCTFRIIKPPKVDGADYKLQFLKLFGLFRYDQDFTFSVCGYYIIMLLGQIGKVVHVTVDIKQKKQAKDDIEVDEGVDEEVRIARMLLEEEKKARREKLEKKVKALVAKAYNILSGIFSYLSVAGIVVVGITAGYYRNRLAFHILCVIFMVIVMVALYKRIVFQFVKFVSGVMIMFAAFYKTVINEDCLNFDDPSCLVYGKWDSIPNMIKTGLVAPVDMSLAEFTWSLMVIYLLATFLTGNPKALERKIPAFISGSILVIVAVLHILYVFAYETSIYSVLFLIVGILMLTCQYLGKLGWVAFACCLSCIVVSFQLCVMLLSHFDDARNLIASLVPETVVNVSQIYEPSSEIVLLAVILFLSTIAFGSSPKNKENFLLDNILYEARVILDLFYFYLCWIFIFAFSIVNNNPSFIKFLLMLFFAFGRWSSPIFWKIRIPFLLFNILYLIAQFVTHIGGWDDPSQPYYGKMNYIGMYFAAPPDGKPSISERNISVAWQLVVVFLGVINAKPYTRHVPPPKFEKMLGTRIYNALCSTLHHWLPIIIQISLCTSTLFNPSIFGWFSFIVMIIVNFKPKILNSGANIITLIFNICFIAQYLLYLGFPKAIFNKDWSAMDYFDKNNESHYKFVEDWLTWLGIYNVKTQALTSNCISAYIFTFYLTWHNAFVDYDLRYHNLPVIIRAFVDWFTRYVFEIMFVLIMIVNTMIDTVDGFLFYILNSALFTAALFRGYSKRKTLRVMSIGTFVVIALRLLSRMPIFSEKDIGKWAREAFDLPFQSSSRFETLWIIVYALQRLAIHIIQSPIYNDCSEKHVKHMAFKFIRSRQLRIIEKLDQEILTEKHKNELSQIRSMAEQNVDEMVANLKRQDTQMLGKVESKSLSSFQTDEKKSVWQQISEWVIYPITDNFIKIVAQSENLNSEAGMNVLTLQTLSIIMKKMLRSYAQGTDFVPEGKEFEFLQKLPPSFPLHYHSLMDVVGNVYEVPIEKDRWMLVVRYILLFCRKISLPALTLMIFIYICIKPYLWALIMFLLFVGFILPLDLKGTPILHTALMSMSLVILGIRHFCTLDILRPYILESENSVTVTQMAINLYQLFGLSPNDSSTCEVFVFLFTSWFIVDQISQSEIFTVQHYYQKFSGGKLPGFPGDYCSGIIDNPEFTLGMDVQKSLGIKEQVTTILKRKGGISTQHNVWALIVDTISFIVLLICWGTWVSGDEQASLISNSSSFTFNIDVGFVFILFIHVAFSLTLFWCELADRYFSLYIVNVVWMAYTYCMTYFYIPVENRNVSGSLTLYFLLRFLAALIIAHKCFVGRINISFKYPNFALNWRSIIASSKFIRICPFVFEIQTILFWMAQDTYTKLMDFMIFRDMALQLEALIAEQADPKYDDPPKSQKRICTGGVLMFILALLLFGPLFFMTESAGGTVNNPPLSMQLEIGVSGLPAFYQSNGFLVGVSKGEHQQIADAGYPTMTFMVLSDVSCLTRVEFPMTSHDGWQPNEEAAASAAEMLESSRAFQYYIKFTLVFDRATTSSSSTTVTWQRNIADLSFDDRQVLEYYLTSGEMGRDGDLSPITVPMDLVIPSEDRPVSLNILTRNVILTPSFATGPLTWSLTFGEQTDTQNAVPFMNTVDSYSVLVWSQPVASDNLIGALLSDNGGIVGIYILIIITFGLVIRSWSTSQGDDLWLTRMDSPQKLYRMVVAIEAFRQAKDPQKEQEMMDQFLDTLRSHETCLKITSSGTVS